MNKFIDWVQEFYEHCPDQLGEALKIVNNVDFKVIIFETDELGEDEIVWAIESFNDPGFWMTAKDTKEEAIKFCEDVGWKIEKIFDDEK